jgi:hypothetical protein
MSLLTCCSDSRDNGDDAQELSGKRALKTPGVDGELLEESAYLRRERLVVALFLLFAVATLAHFVHSSWDFVVRIAESQRALHPAATVPVAYAPNLYRVAMPLLFRLFHLKGAIAPTVTDAVFGYAALSLIYLILADSIGGGAALRIRRALAIAFFLAAIQFPLNWVVPWQRPETMPTAFFVAAATTAVVRLERGTGWMILLGCLTVWQAFVRADAPFLYGVGVLVLAAAGPYLSDFASRRRCVLAGAMIAGIAALIQAYLQFVRFPHTPYPPGTRVFMLLTNLQPHFLQILLLALLPFIAVVVAGIRLKFPFRSIDRLAISTSLFYLPIWCAVGLVAEVRIYVPFLLLLTIPAARILSFALAPSVESEIAVGTGEGVS